MERPEELRLVGATGAGAGARSGIGGKSGGKEFSTGGGEVTDDEMDSLRECGWCAGMVADGARRDGRGGGGTTRQLYFTIE